MARLTCLKFTGYGFIPAIVAPVIRLAGIRVVLQTTESPFRNAGIDGADVGAAVGAKSTDENGGIYPADVFCSIRGYIFTMWKRTLYARCDPERAKRGSVYSIRLLSSQL